MDEEFTHDWTLLGSVLHACLGTAVIRVNHLQLYRFFHRAGAVCCRILRLSPTADLDVKFPFVVTSRLSLQQPREGTTCWRPKRNTG